MTATKPIERGGQRAKLLPRITAPLVPRDVSPLKPELARVYRMAREAWGGSQEELAAAIGVQQKFVSMCESADQRETFNSIHLEAGPGAWSMPIMTAMVVRLGAQLIRAVEIKHPTHVLRLATVMRSSSGVTCEYSSAIAREQEALSIASLDANLRAVRAAQDDLLEAERALLVALMRARGAK
jgi:hypothetical protein